MTERIFHLCYSTARSLATDFTNYFSHGGAIVACRELESPAPNTLVTLRIESPNGEVFEFRARAGNYVSGRGFLASFEGGVSSARTKLDAHVASDAFRARCAAEDPDVDVGPSIEIAAGRDAEPRTDPDIVVPDDLLDAGTTDTESAAVIVENVEKPKDDAILVYVVEWSRVTDFARIVPTLEETSAISVSHAEVTSSVGRDVIVRLVLPGHNVFELSGAIRDIEGTDVRIAIDRDGEAFAKACAYVSSRAGGLRIESEEGSAPSVPRVLRTEEPLASHTHERMPMRWRLARMGMDDKINLALSGDREERMALAMDGNRAVHPYLLKNARLSIEEVAFMARLQSMNPMVLTKIAETSTYTQNVQVAKALVYNPKTPISSALRMLDRLPNSELSNIAKRTQVNLRLATAAKDKLLRRKA